MECKPAKLEMRVCICQRTWMDYTIRWELDGVGDGLWREQELETCTDHTQNTQTNQQNCKNFRQSTRITPQKNQFDKNPTCNLSLNPKYQKPIENQKPSPSFWDLIRVGFKIRRTWFVWLDSRLWREKLAKRREMSTGKREGEMSKREESGLYRKDGKREARCLRERGPNLENWKKNAYFSLM